MATEIGARLSFLPWVRQGAAAGIAAVDTLGAGQAGSVKLTASVELNGAPAAALPVRLLGPADVLGLGPRQIVRTDPRPSSAGFEPNYVLPARRAAEQVSFGAVARSALRTSGVARFRDELVSVAVKVKPLQLVVASTADLSVLPSSESWIEALATVGSLNRKSGDTAWQLVPAHELVA